MSDEFVPLSEYVPIRVAVVTARLKGDPIPPEIELASHFPCPECGAPAGMACRETSNLCWRARVLTRKQWNALQTARKLGKGASGGFRDEIYQGFNRMGQIHKDADGAQNAIRFMSKARVAMIKEVLDARGDKPF
jgi:hypothetical protein